MIYLQKRMKRMTPSLITIALGLVLAFVVESLDTSIGTIEDVERLAGLGVRAIKLHPHTQEFDPADPRVLALSRRAGELGVVVLMDNANVVAGDSQALLNLALKAPKTRFVFNHLGGLDFRFWNILPLAHTAKGLMSDNIHFDLSGTILLAADSPIRDEFVWTLRNVGVDNVLFGSDFPQLSIGQTLAALDKLGLTDEEKRKDEIRRERISLHLLNGIDPDEMLIDLRSCGWERRVDGFFSINAMVHIDLQYLIAYLITAGLTLRPGGKLVMTLANAVSDLGFEKLVRDLSWTFPVQGRPLGSGKFEWLSPDIVESLLPRLGFDIDLLDNSERDLAVVASLAEPGRPEMLRDALERAA